MAFLPALRIFFLSALAFFSFVLYGVACAGLATNQLRGDAATAIVAFSGGLTSVVVPGVLVLAAFQPNKWIATSWFEFSFLSTLFVFSTAGMASFTSDTTIIRRVCGSPPALPLRPTEFDLLCTLTTTIVAVGWVAWSFLVLPMLVTAVLLLRRWWWKDEGASKIHAGELWREGWWRPWRGSRV